MKRGRFITYIWPILGLLLLIPGLFAYKMQLDRGLSMTGMGRPVFWGLYIVSFVFCIGACAGGTIVDGVVHAFKLDWLRPIGPTAILTGLSFLAMAMLAIVVDLGRPDRALMMVLNGRAGSPLVWDATALTSCGVLGLVIWVLALLEERPGGASKRTMSVLRTLAILSLPAFLMLHTVTAWILGLVQAQPGWNTPILAPLFIFSAMASGVSILFLALILVKARLGFELGERIRRFFRLILVLSLVGLIYLMFCEYLTARWSGDPQHRNIVESLFSGRFALIFWMDMLGGIVVPLLLLSVGKLPGIVRMGTAAGLIAVGVFAERVYILLPSLFANPRTGSHPAYTPSLLEATVVLGILGVGMLVFWTGTMIQLRVRRGAVAVKEPVREPAQPEGAQIAA